MSTLRSKITWASVALIAIGYMGRPEPVQARGFGSFGAGMIAGAVLGGMARGHFRSESRRTRTRTREAPVRESRPGREPRDEQATKQLVASLGAPSSQDQIEVLSRINATEVVTVVGTTKDLGEVGKTTSNEEGRDYTKKIKAVIERFKKEAEKAKDKTRGDITEHAIEQSLDKAFKTAKLSTFESFLGENWSAERLRVMVMERVEAELGRLFEGNNQGNTPMEDVDRLIQRSAESVYRRIFETSELLAANRGSALFVQRLYQTHGGLVDDQLREIADRMIAMASNAAVARFDALMRRDENGFALRYRAQRIVFDCLSENVEKISSSETGIATAGEIEQKILDTSKTTCAAWLDNQFGKERDEIKSQKPMPLRVVWSANGPKDDPSMYGRASGSF
jgi:hypothetical protein